MAYRVLAFLCRPVVAGLSFNAVVIITHVPVVVNESVANGPFHYGLHVLVVSLALLMWMPVCGPFREFHMQPLGKCIYLFLQSIVPTLPAAWLTFADGAVYSSYDKPYRLWGHQHHHRPAARRGDHEDRWVGVPVGDHHLHLLQAFRRQLQGRARLPPPAASMPTAEIVGNDEVPLTTADVEREFATTASPRPPRGDERNHRAHLTHCGERTAHPSVRSLIGTTAIVRAMSQGPPVGRFAHRRVTAAWNRADRDDGRQVACDVVIDQRLLRTDLPMVEEALGRRHRPALLDDVRHAARLDARLRSITQERDDIRARVNAISKEVGALRRAGDVDAAETRQDESRAPRRHRTCPRRRARRGRGCVPRPPARHPQPASPRCPDGAGEDDNPLVRGPIGLLDAYPDHQRVPHWETATALGILDNERAAKISGAMFTMQRGAGATLSRALCQYGLDLNADAFEEIRPPSLVTTATLTATGQLPKFADDAYAIERDDLWCIPTAEVPLTSIYAGEILDDPELPIRVMAYSASYERGRDRPAVTRGMLRAHEFDKVEILSFATPEQAPDLLVDMVGRAEKAIAGLGLPYRIIEICTGDMGQSHHRSFDIEVYAPGADTWLEVSSISWFSDYQARRGNIRFRRHDADGKPLKGTEFVHTLNGSALAVPRVGGDHRELPQRRRVGHRARGAASVHARHHPHRTDLIDG